MPRTATKKVETQEIEPVVEEKPKKQVKAAKKVVDLDSEPSDHDEVVSNGDKKHRKVSIDKILAMLKKGDVEKATHALEDMVQEKKDKKPRAPSAFNLFVKEKMADLKVSEPNMSTKERMGLCAKLWKDRNN